MSPIILKFRQAKVPSGAKPPASQYRASLSTLAFSAGGRAVFLGGDETIEGEPTIEMLTREDGGDYGHHQSLPISNFIPLPDTSLDDGRVGEIDIEGLACDGGYLWVVGSHSCNRKQPKPGQESVAESLEKLAEIKQGKNRFFLGRIPLKDEPEAPPKLLKTNGSLRAGRVLDSRPDGPFLKRLANDEHFGPFFTVFKNHKGKSVRLPSKDNGFDIEGLAVRGHRILLGLRGPVLRGWACILELQVQKDGNKGDLTLQELVAAADGADGRSYHKHFVALDGLGIRDLELVGDDLLILAGPTMALDGPARIFEWKDALTAMSGGDTLTPQASGVLTRILQIPVTEGHDHPEGIALLGETKHLAVVYDSPDPARHADLGPNDGQADVFRLP